MADIPDSTQKIQLNTTADIKAMLGLQEEEILVFRVSVSGEAQSFDNINVALDYQKAQARENRIENMVFEVVKMNRQDYALEVEKQESEGKQ